MPDLARRSLAKLSLAGAALLGAKPALAANLADFTPVPLPLQLPAKTAVAALPNANLAYWDTGSGREAMILLHPATGSNLVWSYQQPAFAGAGYRVIAYSRRGFAGSDHGNGQGSDTQDLLDLADLLGLRKFHLVSTAAGAFTGLDFAVKHQDRLLTLTLACSITGSDGAGTGPARDRLRPAAFNSLPPSFQELSPSYRAANPEGMAAWEALQRGSRGPQTSSALPAGGPPRQATITPAMLHGLTIPTLLIAGGADLFAPPPLMRALKTLLPNASLTEIPDAGHSVYWEQPAIFNKLVLNFLRRSVVA
jgi:pimeloyl-ACP methyl ester carboxylesterase